MHFHHVDYRARSIRGGARPPRGQVVNVGFWASGLARPLLTCRLLGHKPVVDGYDSGHGDGGSRWVCCDRCGTRPDPQGHLPVDRYPLDAPYTGPWGEPLPDGHRARRDAVQLRKSVTGFYAPGRMPTGPGKGAVGGQLVVGGHWSGVGLEVKVGNCGSEHTLAATVKAGWLGALYLHTETFGTWLQRRLNPVGYQSKLIGVEVAGATVRWKMWSDRDGHRVNRKNVPLAERIRDTIREGSVNLDPRDRLLGRRRYDYTDVPDSQTTVTVRMAAGDDHQVTLKLQRCTLGRDRWRRRRPWSVDWSTRPGIPTKPGDRGRIQGSAVDVSDKSVALGTWPSEAAAAIAAKMEQHRTGYEYAPTGVKVKDAAA